MKLLTAQEARAWSNYKYYDPFIFILIQLYYAISQHDTCVRIPIAKKYVNDELMEFYIANFKHNGYVAKYDKYDDFYDLYIYWNGEENDTI